MIEIYSPRARGELCEAFLTVTEVTELDNSVLFQGKLNVPDMLKSGLERGGDSVFAIYQHADGSREEISYCRIREEGERLAEKLASAGLRRGDRIGIVSALRPWWYSLYYACTLGGYIMVCIDPGVPMTQIHTMLRQTEVRAVFTTSANFALPANFENHIPFYDIAEGFPLRQGGSERVDRLLPPVSKLPDGTDFILFSSGTTGERRKGVLLPFSSVADAIEWHYCTDSGIYKDEPAYNWNKKRELMMFPPYHIAGLLCTTAGLYGNTQVIMVEKLTPHALVSVLQELHPDNICTVPSMLTTLMKKMRSGLDTAFKRVLVNSLLGICGFVRRRFGWRWGRKLLHFLNEKALGGSVTNFMIGASPIDEETMRFFLDMGIDVSLAYGLTELGAPLACTGSGYYLGSTGRVSHHHSEGLDIRIVNPDENGRGEVEVLSPFRMLTYLNEEDMEGCFTEDGYFKTGDLGWFNEEQCLVIAGRAKEAIVLRNGEKLLPEEIESHYQNLEDVSEICAFRVSGEGGCDAFALAAVKDKSHGIPDESTRLHILDHAANLPAVYQPKEVYVLSELPRSSTNKPQRFRLTEMVEKGLTAPVSEASLRPVGEEGPAAELRSLLIQVAGPQWKTAELTEGLLLNLDSLQNIDLFVAIEETFGVDLFRLATMPETFGALLEAVTEYDTAEKNDKPVLDLSRYPEPVSGAERALGYTLGASCRTVWKVHSSGTEHIPTEGNYLLCSNHITVLDPTWICGYLPREQRLRTAIVGKSSLLEDKKYRALVRSHNLIPVDRTGNSMATLERCLELLQQGWNVLIFPEGTNYEAATTMLSFREGPARLAIAAGVPVVPVHIKGVKPMDMEHPTFLPPIGGPIEVAFGEPISPVGIEDPAELNAILRAAIENL